MAIYGNTIRLAAGALHSIDDCCRTSAPLQVISVEEFTEGCLKSRGLGLKALKWRTSESDNTCRRILMDLRTEVYGVNDVCLLWKVNRPWMMRMCANVWAPTQTLVQVIRSTGAKRCTDCMHSLLMFVERVFSKELLPNSAVHFVYTLSPTFFTSRIHHYLHHIHHLHLLHLYYILHITYIICITFMCISVSVI